MGIESDFPALGTALVTKLRSVLEPLGAAVIDTFPSEGDDFPRLPDGQIRPTALVDLGTPDEIGYRSRGITGAADQMLMTDVAVLCVAGSASDCNSLVGMVIGAYRGFEPIPGAGELTCYGAPARAPVADVQHPARFAKTVGFGLSFGALVVT